MNDTQALLDKITALRQRLEQARGLVDDAGSAAASLVQERGNKDVAPWNLERQARAGAQADSLLDVLLRPLAGAPGLERLPGQLTARARWLLERVRELLARLRTLGDDLARVPPPDQGEERALSEEDEPLTAWYRATVAMADAALRMIGTFPDAPSTQLRLCEGIEAILAAVDRRTARLDGILQRRRREHNQVETLASLLTELAAGKAVSIRQFAILARTVLEEAQGETPLTFFQAAPDSPERFVACHSLNVAQVAARVLCHDPEWSRRAMDAILAALVHDVGMLNVPIEVLIRPDALENEQRRAMESHPWHGAEAAARLLPGEAWLVEAVAQHHEHLDGTGYPAGLTDRQIAPLARLLAVCDTYAALCAPRPYRPARETRAAMADTLLLAEEGLLDRSRGEQLLALSFYPTGSVVELADGSVGVVTATPNVVGMVPPDRPMLALLTDSQGRPLPFPRSLDLTRREDRSVVRSLTAEERRALLGNHYPEFV